MGLCKVDNVCRYLISTFGSCIVNAILHYSTVGKVQFIAVPYSTFSDRISVLYSVIWGVHSSVTR